ENLDPYTLELVFGPICDDVCAFDTATCEDNAIRTCVPDEEGCPMLAEPVPCDMGSACIEGVCVAPGDGDTCDNPIVIDASTPTHTLMGDFEAPYTNAHEGSCGGEGLDQIFTFDLSVPTEVSVQAYGSDRVYDTIIYLRSTCQERNSEEACNDDETPPGNRGSGLTQILAPGTWFLILDTFDETTRPYTLDIQFDPVCENVCEADAVQCSDDTIMACTISDEGCLEWTAQTTCAPNERCERATCVLACVDTCTQEGATQCATSTAIHTCLPDPDTGCMGWRMETACNTNEVCSAGACIPEPSEPDAGTQTDTEMVTTSGSSDGGCSTAAPGRRAWPNPAGLIVWMALALWVYRSFR
ncbi:MAG: hypothetical protein AAFS10_01630, partial [Myxococcota bacterium]